MTEKRLRTLVGKIPGEAGWWHGDGEDTYQGLATKLRSYGVPADDVLDILSDAYSAAAGEFGS